MHIARFMQKPDEQDAPKTSTNSTWQDSEREREKPHPFQSRKDETVALF
jgi:hypothetical protein